MRGTGYAISEIVWWMLAAGLIGAAIGWMLRRVFGGGRRAEEAEAKLESQQERYARISGELGEWKTKAEKLKTDLGSKDEQLIAANRHVKELEGKLAGARTELDTATAKTASLEANLGDVRDELDVASAKAATLETKVSNIADKDAEIERLGGEVAGIAGLQSTLGDRDSKLAELEAQLEARDSELAELQAAHAGCAVNAEENLGKVAGLQAAVGERDAKIAGLQAELANTLTASPAAPVSTAAPVASISTDLEALAESESDHAGQAVPMTKFGTPGADHRDDLKVINGIGPKLESTLNEFGIQSWEQLAALTDSEVEIVNEALDEFPGRITRDGWVAQASDLVARFPDRSDRPDRTNLLNDSPS